MPAAAPALAIAFAGGIGPATAMQLFAAKFIIGVVASVAFNFVAGALTKKEPKSFDSFASIRSNGATQQFRQAITERRMIYGEIRTSGPIVFPRVTDNNKYLHMVIVLAAHEVEAIDEIIIDETSITDDMLDADGNVTSGRYSGYVRIRKHLGAPDQAADAKLVAEVSDWTTDHRLRNCAYLYVRYQWNRDKFPTGIPNASAWVRGKKPLDPRDDAARWTPNVALMTRDYLTDTRLGLRTATQFINDTAASAAANTCDEFVATATVDVEFTAVNASTDIITLDGTTLALQRGDRVQVVTGTIGGITAATDYYVIPYQRMKTPRIKLAASLEDALAGTAVDLTSGTTGTIRKNAEPRYYGGALIKTDAERGNNLQDLISGMAGQAVYSGGSWRILAGEYQTPTIYFNEDDVVGNVRLSTKVSKSDRFNRVQGVYISPVNDGNPADYPMVLNSTYTTEDGEEIKRNLDLSVTQRSGAAQRIAKIALERMRQEIIFEATFKLTGMKVQVGDNFFFSFARYGWTDKVFEVIDWALGVEDNAPVVIIKARENASAVYDWNNGEETTVDPAPNTDLPDLFTVEVVGGFSLDSILVMTQGTDKTFNIVASWDLHDNEFVVSGGRYEIEFKRSDETENQYKSLAKVDGTVGTVRINNLEPDVEYDIRIFVENSLGVRSQPTLIENFVVGTTVTTNTEDWENETLARSGDDWENDTLTNEDWES